MYGSLQAALPFRGDSIIWPMLDSRHAVDGFDLDQIYRGARYLEKNSGIIGKAVEDVVNLQGWLVPEPKTTDKEWNKLARSAFIARTKNERLFDVAGQHGWKSAQVWMETQRCIDGDCLCVLCRNDDGGGSIALYDAAQIRTGVNEKGIWNMGVRVNSQGRPTHYAVYDWEAGTSVAIEADAAVLYRHNPSSTMPRGLSDLHRILVHGIDIAETNGFTKEGIKIAAMVGLIETKSAGDKASQTATRMGGRSSGTPGGLETDVLTVSGTKMISLAPGRDIKTLSDGRPSANAMNFTKQLITEIAWGVGLEPQILYYVDGMGSSGARFSLEKLRRWILKRRIWREQLVNRIYQHIIACEIDSGRLRPCKAEAWQNVEWTALRDMTIDRGREGSLAINLIREGLMDASRWTLDTEEKTQTEILEANASALREAVDIAQRYHLPLDLLMRGSIGATAPTPTPENIKTEAIPDSDPEA